MVDEVIEARRAGQRRRVDRMNAIVLCAGLIGMLTVVGRVVQLQVAPDAALRDHIQQRVSKRVEPGRRGDIVDRRGRLLAATRSGSRLFLDPSAFEEPYGPKIAAIAAMTGVAPERVGERVISRIARNRERAAEGKTLIQYVSIGGALSDEQLARARRLDIKGVHLERVAVREPIGDASIERIIGKVGTDGDGLAGIERSFDAELEEHDGTLDYVRDALGRPLWVEARGYQRASYGEQVRLSIDLVVQELARQELVRGIEEADAAGGRAIVIDPSTGEILAMADEIREPPDAVAWDPKVAAEAARKHTFVRFRVVPPDPLRDELPALARNRCVVDVYEPGSTFKPFMWASVTERGLATPDEMIKTHRGRWRTDYGRTIEDVVPLDEQSWHDVLVHSSNIGMTEVTQRLTPAQMHEDVLRFGFGGPTGIGLPGEASGLVTSLKDWSKYTQTSVAFGYEIAVTPLQIVRGFSVFARMGVLAGTLPKLRLTAMPGGVDRATYERVISAKTAALTRDAMGDVGKNLLARYPRWHPEDPPFEYTLFGKSGTAKIVHPDGRGYFDRQYCSSFIAAAPADFPRIVVLVVIDDPGPALRARRAHYGSHCAGPVVVRIVRRTLEYLGVPPEGEDGSVGRVAATD